MLTITNQIKVFISVLKNYTPLFANLEELKAELTEYDSDSGIEANSNDEELDVISVIRQAQDGFVDSAWEAFIFTYIVKKLETDLILLQPYKTSGMDDLCDFIKQGKRCFNIFCLPKNGTQVFDYYSKKNIELTKDTKFYFEEFVEFGGYVQGVEDNFDYFVCGTNNTRRILKVDDCNFYAVEVTDNTNSHTHNSNGTALPSTSN